jgi:glycosyltransferase involved in cell wall biosynthesis
MSSLVRSYPRVLFITPCAFNHITGGGVTFSSLFSGWPKDRIAVITDDIIPVSRDVCSRYFFLSHNERPYISPFNWFYKQKRGGESNPNLAKFNKVANESSCTKKSRLFRIAKNILGDAGIPDRGMLTQELYLWIKKYQPDIIYTILGTLGYIELVEKIQQEFNLSVVIHLMDDGVTDPQLRGLFGRYLRQKYNIKFRSLLDSTTARIAICESMAEEYEKRYGYSFSHFQHTVDVEKWSRFSKQDVSLQGQIKVLYAGSILPNAQLQSLNDFCRAITELSDEGVDISMDIYTPLNLFGCHADTLPRGGAVNIFDTITDDEEFHKVLGDADFLVLPVNFDGRSVQFIRYSMPTKIPSYLLSGTPIFVYGPESVTQVEYAVDEQWGYVVSQRGIQYIKDGLLELISNKELRKKLSCRAGKAVRNNHDSNIVRKKFQDLIINSAG